MQSEKAHREEEPPDTITNEHYTYLMPYLMPQQVCAGCVPTVTQRYLAAMPAVGGGGWICTLWLYFCRNWARMRMASLLCWCGRGAECGSTVGQ